MAIQGGSFGAGKGCSGSNARVLDGIDLDTQRYFGENQENMLFFHMEWFTGKKCYSMGSLGEACSSKGSRGLGFTKYLSLL